MVTAGTPLGVLNTFICSFIPSVLTEHLLYARYWGQLHLDLQNCHCACLVEPTFWEEEGRGGHDQTSKHTLCQVTVHTVLNRVARPGDGTECYLSKAPKDVREKTLPA